MKTYRRFYHTDPSNISLEHWKGSLSQSEHMHKYYEFLLIEKGSCIHIYNEDETILIPGDSLLIPPEKAHSFLIHDHTSIYNCQFYSDSIDEITLDLLVNSDEYFNETSAAGEQLVRFKADINKNKIIHFSSSDYVLLISLLGAIQVEQENMAGLSMLLKKKYLETVLILYHKRMEHQFKNYELQGKGSRHIITETLTYIEENLADNIDFNELTSSKGISLNHFRKLFKDATGLSPIEYINRLRITNACNYLQNTDFSITEIAARVGINDVNYFSRMFKQYMGYSPKKYRSHPGQ